MNFSQQIAYPQQFVQPQPFAGPQQLNRQPVQKPYNFGFILVIIFSAVIIWYFFLKQDGSYGEWGSWTECKPFCGENSKKSRKREYKQASNGGSNIAENDRVLYEEESCNRGPCPEDSKMTEWLDIDGKCYINKDETKPVLCGIAAQKKQTREYVEPKNGGIDNISFADKTNTSRWILCDFKPCDGKYSDFSEWSLCSSIYKGGEQTRIKEYIPSDPGGIDNKIEDKNVIIETRDCGTMGLPPKDVVSSPIAIDNICYLKPSRTSEISKCWRETNKGYKEMSTKTIFANGQNPETKYSWAECTPTDKYKVCNNVNGSCSNWVFDKFVNKNGNNVASFKRMYNHPIDYGNDSDCKNELTTIEINKITYYQNDLKITNSDESTCIPTYGKSRKKNVTWIYTLPTIHIDNLFSNPHHTQITNIFTSNDINSFYSLKFGATKIINKSDITYTIKKITNDDILPIKIEIIFKINCADNLQSSNDILDIWNSELKCTTALPTTFIDYYNNTNISLDNLLSMETMGDIKNKISSYNIINLFNQQKSGDTNFDKFIKSINECSGNAKIIPGTNQPKRSNNNILYPGLCYNDNYTITNGLYKATFGGSLYNIALYNDSSVIPYYSDSISKSKTNSICMQDDGNFVIYNNDRKALWNSNTDGNPGAYLELLNNGFIVIKNKNGTIIYTLDFEKVTRGHIDVTKTFQMLSGGQEILLPDKSVIYKGIQYSNNFKWSSGSFNLIMQNDGNLVLYKDNKTSGEDNAIWYSSTFGNPNAYLVMQLDGHLIIRRDGSNDILWKNDYYSNSELRSAKLVDKGYLVIFNQNNNAARVYPDILYDYVYTRYWKNSPWSLFSDYAGRVYKATWEELDKRWDDEYIPSDDADYTRFRGWRRKCDESQWKVTERDLNHHAGYDNELSTITPDSCSDSSNNWNNSNDRDLFNKIQNTIRYPKSISGNNTPNAIPGYIRVSNTTGENSAYKTHKFLISIRSGTKWDQAFVLYRLKSQKDFTNDLITNHKGLIKNIVNNDEAYNYISREMLGLGDDKWSNDLKEYLKSKYS